VRFARWDLKTVDVVDPRDRAVVLATLYPLDKQRNADGRRRRLAPLDNEQSSCSAPDSAPDEVAPLLRKYMEDYAATGLPPAYLRDHRGGHEEDDPHPDNEENDE
jgi:hypothetical protein